MNLINDKKLEELLKQSPAVRVTKEYIDSRINSTHFMRIPHSPTVTLCTIILDNGYSVRGESSCVKPENYNSEIGEKIAYDNAYDKLWPLFGFLLAESIHTQVG